MRGATVGVAIKKMLTYERKLRGSRSYGEKVVRRTG